MNRIAQIVQFDTVCSGICSSDIPSTVAYEKLELYPNPSDGILHIANLNPLDAVIEIYSINGTIVFRKEVLSNSEQIDLSPFSKGVYFVTVRSKEYVRTAKIVKL